MTTGTNKESGRSLYRPEGRDAIEAEEQEDPRDAKSARMFTPPHPGEVVRKYLGEMKVTAAAKHLGVGRVTLSRLLNGKAAVSPEMAVRLAAAFSASTPEFWLEMQAQYDLWQIQQRTSIRVEPLPQGGAPDAKKRRGWIFE